MTINGIVAAGTKFEIESGTGGAKTITDIALGYPTILTSVAHALLNGDVVTLALFAGDDAAVLNGKTAIVKYVTDDTFAIAIDTTGLTITDNTDTATATPETWTEIGEVVDWDGPSESAAEIDMSHLQSVAKEVKMGIPDSGTFTFTVNWHPQGTGQLALQTARAGSLEKDFKITYSDLSTETFSGFVLGFPRSGGGVDDKVVGNVTIRITGATDITPS